MIKTIGFFIKFFIIFAVSVLIILKFGIKIDNLSLLNLHFEQLYIKLDKKIILRANNITLPDLKKDDDIGSSDYLLDLSQNAYFLGLFFEEILLNEIKVGEISVKVIYKDGNFFIDSPYFLADLSVLDKIDKNTQKIAIKRMEFKDFKVNIWGNVSANLRAKEYEFSGKFDSYELNGNMNFTLKSDILRYEIFNVSAKSLADFMTALDNRFGLNKEVRSWIYGYIVADEYLVKQINGRVNLATNDFFLDDLNATATAKNLSVKLDKSLEPILVSEADISLINSKLNFSLKSPKYQGKSLDGSTLYIYNIFNENSAGIFLDLQTKSLYDKYINDILKVYGIAVPINQTSGKMDAKLTLDINFNTLNVIANGKFIAKNAKFLIANAPFLADEAVIELNNSFNMKINAKNFGMSFFNSDAVANFDLKNSKATINGTLKNLKIDELLDIKNEPFNATLDFSKSDTKLDFNELGLNFIFGDKSKISIQKPENFILKSKLLSELNIKDATFLELTTSDFNNFKINANDVKFSLPLLNKNGSDYDKQSFEILVDNEKISGKSSDDFIKFKSDEKQTKIEIKNIDVAIKDSDTNATFKGEIFINGTNSNLIFTDVNKTLKLPKYEIFMKNRQIKFLSTPENGRISILKNDENITLEANNISGEYLNQFIGKEVFFGGNFKLKTIGTAKNRRGEVRFYDAYFRDYLFYSRLLSFINSVPALLSLKTPDFNDKGFKAKNGKIIFKQESDILNFIAIEISGSSANIIGKGEIDLKTRKINIDLELEILKDASNIIEKIPLVNQIILGKDRTLSTLIKVRGTLDEPTYSTEVIKDTLLVPFKLIRNILQTPFLIFE